MPVAGRGRLGMGEGHEARAAKSLAVPDRVPPNGKGAARSAPSCRAPRLPDQALRNLLAYSVRFSEYQGASAGQGLRLASASPG